ncbi:MAG TPA: DUF5317 domain-containing protein [Ilumatobacteraceae bacterium]|nr:DUF5317 domain-containing protein [Ilumatobacteraceae bacterium]
MIVLVLVALAILSIPVCGGSFAELTKLPVRAAWLVVFGFGIQFVVISVYPTMSHDVALTIHLASYGFAASFFVLNRRIAWMWLVGVGGVLNLTVIVANGGVMPASAWATRVAGNVVESGKFANSTVVDHPRLQFLGDVFAIPESWPLSNVFSIGDVLLVVGCVLVLHAGSGAPWTQSDRPALFNPSTRDETASWL